MANVTSGNPIKIDTATVSYAAIALPNTMSLDVRTIYWESPAAAGDTAQITNADNLVLWEAKAEAAAGNPGSSLVFYFQPRALVLTKKQGWFPKTVTSGTIWIYFDYV